MKNFISALCFFITVSAIAQTGAIFEYKMTSEKGMNGNMKMYYSTAGSRVEMSMSVPQMPGGGISRTSIMKKSEPKKSYILDDKNKTYMVSEIKEPSKESSEAPVVKIIGKEKVGSYNCVHAQVTSKTGVTDYWTSTEIPGYDEYMKHTADSKFMADGGVVAALSKAGAPGFIVKSISTDPRGGKMTMELVKMEKKEPAASLFEIPADYKNTSVATPVGAAIDPTMIQNMTPEEREKYIEDMKKKYEKQGGN